MTERRQNEDSDRRVHARAPAAEIVRYERAGAWWVEDRVHGRGRVSVYGAALTAVDWERYEGGEVFLGLPGGAAFDRKVRQLR